MSWLVKQERVLATLEVADGWRSRLVGIIGQDTLEGALLIAPAFSVHTFGVKFAIDVAYCDRDLRVIDIVTMETNRMGRPRLRSRSVVEAPKGSFERWGLHIGDQLEVRQ